jgi:hypothetical protein
LPSAGFEPAIPSIKRLQTYDLDRTTTGIGNIHLLGFNLHGFNKMVRDNTTLNTSNSGTFVNSSNFTVLLINLLKHGV